MIIEIQDIVGLGGMVVGAPYTSCLEGDSRNGCIKPTVYKCCHGRLCLTAAERVTSFDKLITGIMGVDVTVYLFRKVNSIRLIGRWSRETYSQYPQSQPPWGPKRQATNAPV